MESTRCLSLGEVQKTLGVGRSKVYQLAGLVDFPAVRIGRRIVVPEEALRAWLAAGGTAQTASEDQREGA